MSVWRHVWTIEAGAAGAHPVLLMHAGRALWWYGQARKVTYSLIDDDDDRSERSEHDGTARPPSTAVPYIPVTQRGRPSDPNPIRQRSHSSETVEQMIEQIVVYDRVHQHHQVERPGGEGTGEGEEKGSGSKGRGEARRGQRRARPWQSTTSTSCRRGGTSSTSECSSRIGEGQ